MILAFAGILAGAAIVEAVGQRRPGIKGTHVERSPGCSVSILLLATSQKPHAIVADRSTGSRGFSHVAWDACESAGGVAYGIDCRPGHGVHRRPLEEIIDGRRAVRIYLPPHEGAEAYGCARGMVGVPYDGIALFRGPGSSRRGTICSELIYECLPEALKARIRLPSGRPLSPNDIAAAFGVAGPHSPDVEI